MAKRKKKEQNDKPWSTRQGNMKTKTGANVDAPKGLGCSCANSGTRRFTFAKIPMRSHECGNIRNVITTKETYSWYFVTEILRSDYGIILFVWIFNVSKYALLSIVMPFKKYVQVYVWSYQNTKKKRMRLFPVSIIDQNYP